MSEKLSSFLSLYSSKAEEYLNEWKEKTAADEVKWKKLTDETYPAALKTATDLNQVETFQQVFPSPGTYVENVAKYGAMLGVDTGFEKQLKELYKTRNTKTQIANRKKYLAEAQKYVEKGGEDYINRLVHEIFSKAADAASRGAKFNEIIDQLFKSYPDYTEFLEDLIDHVPGPDGVLTKPETYAVLLEKKEAGAFTLGAKTNEATTEKKSEATTEKKSETTPTTETKPESTTEKTKEGSEKKVESSPINTGEKPKPTPSGESKPGEKSAINAGTEKKTESTSVTSAEGQVTSKPGELTKEEPKAEGKTSTAINVNLETTGPAATGVTGKEPETKSPQAINTQTEPVKKAEVGPSEKEKIESTTILNTNSAETKEKILEKEKTSDSTEVKSTTSSVNTETSNSQENSTSVEKTSSTTSEGAVNSPKEEKKKGGFLAKLGKISNAVGSALNLPTFKELGSQAAGLFGATGAKFMSNVSDISQSFSKNSINSNTNQKKETAENTTNTSTSASNSEVSSSSTNSNVGETKTSTVNLEKNSPTMSVENTNTTNTSTQTNNEGGSVSSTSTNTNAAPTSSSNQTILQPQSSNQQSNQSQPGPSPSPGMSVDLNGLAQSISRLEKILISGIEVTIKDT